MTSQGRQFAVAWGSAAGLLLVLYGFLGSLQGSWPRPSEGPRMIITLEPPLEGSPTQLLIASLPLPESPAPAEPTPSPRAGLDEETRLMLQREREELRARLKQESVAASVQLSETIRDNDDPPPKSESSQVSMGTIRELDLSGQPQAVVDQVMAKYRLRITQKVVSGESNQNFLSSAATGKGDRYFSGGSNRPGLYQVFELSRESVAKMSRLEEEEIRRREMDPEKTRVKHVVFGITEPQPAQYDLGILQFEAEPL